VALAGLSLFLLRALLSSTPLSLPLDDAYIHSAFAAHLAHDHVWGLFAKLSSGGESSPLWPWLLAPAELGRVHGSPRLALILGALSFLALPGLCFGLSATRTRGRWLAVTTALCGPLLFLAFSGMESLPALCLGLAALHRHQRGDDRGAGLLAAAAVFLRPDAILLLGALALAHLGASPAVAQSEGSSWVRARSRRLLVLAPGGFLSAGAFLLLFALQGFHAPTTLTGRRWLMGLPAELNWNTLGAGAPRLLGEWLHAFGADFGLGRVVFEHPHSLLSFLFLLWKVAFGLTLLAGLYGWSRRWREERGGAVSVLLSWTLLSLGFYALVLPTRGHLGRYQPQVYVLLFFFAIEGIAALRHVPKTGRAAALGAGVLLLAGLGASTVEQSGLWCSAMRHLQSVHVRAATEVSAMLPSSSRLAVFDVGAVAYRSEASMIDLSGLSDPQIAHALPDAQSGSIVRILKERGATHVLLPVLNDGAPDGLDRRLGLRENHSLELVELRRWASPIASWGPAFAYTGNAFRQLVLYEISWES
jgi:hypothetical protein